MERESLEFEMVIVGAAPSGPSTAIRLKQIAAVVGQDLNTQNCVHRKPCENSTYVVCGNPGA
ncbi:hypothetical protein [Azospirillum endophyticum]